MLRELLMRDLTLHRRVLAAAGILPLILAVTLGLSPGANAEGVAAIMVLFGLVLMALVPLGLQTREGMLGTLGDLLALPAPRRDLVRLRLLEGVLASLAYALLHLLSWSAFHRTAPARVLEVFRTPAPLWILLIFLAYPLPFYLRWRGKGVGLAFGLLVGGLYAWSYLVLRRGIQVTWFEGFHRLHDAWVPYSAKVMEFGGPLLLLGLCYLISTKVANRMEA